MAQTRVFETGHTRNHTRVRTRTVRLSNASVVVCTRPGVDSKKRQIHYPESRRLQRRPERKLLTISRKLRTRGAEARQGMNVQVSIRRRDMLICYFYGVPRGSSVSIISSIWQMFNRRKNFEATWPAGARIIAHARAIATWFAEKTRLRRQPWRRRSRWRGMCRTAWCVPVVFRFRALVFGARVRGQFRRGCKNKPARVRSRRRRDVPVAPVARTAFGWVLSTETTSIQGGAVARTPPKRPRRAPTDPPFERPCLSVRQKIRKIRRALETAWLDRVSRRFQDFRASFHIKLTASIPFLFLFFPTPRTRPTQNSPVSGLV